MWTIGFDNPGIAEKGAKLMKLSHDRRCIKLACQICSDLMKILIPETPGFETKG